MFMLEHHKEPRRHSRRMPHHPRRSGHGHVVPFSPIKDTHPHQSKELGLVGRQVPPSKEPLHKSVNRKGVVEQVVLLT